jgi:hypothetical protein
MRESLLDVLPALLRLVCTIDNELCKAAEVLDPVRLLNASVKVETRYRSVLMISEASQQDS